MGNTKYQKMLTPNVKHAVSTLLGAFVQQEPAAPPAKGSQTPVQDGATPEESALACNPDTVPDCALLHDKLSLMWGEFKDEVDKLTMEMMKNEYEFNELRANLNSQISMLTSAKAKLKKLLGEARS